MILFGLETKVKLKDECVNVFWMDFGLSWQLYSLNEAVDMKLVRKVGPTSQFLSVLGCASHDQPNCPLPDGRHKTCTCTFCTDLQKNCSNCPFPQLLVLAQHWRRLGDLNFGGGGVSPAPELSADGWVYMPAHYIGSPPVRLHCSP